MVLLRGGDYALAAANGFVLGDGDGGAPGLPVTYASFPGERARLHGAIPIPMAAFGPPPPGSGAGPRVVVADLASLPGAPPPALLGRDGDVLGLKAELFLDGGAGLRPLQLAQDPDPGPEPAEAPQWRWAGLENITATAADTSWIVVADADAVPRWEKAAASTGGLWLLGHWGDMEGFDAVRVGSATPLGAGVANFTLAWGDRVGAPTTRRRSRVAGRPARKAVRFVASNALALVDTPGEYWIDRAERLLFYMPVSPGDQLYLSVGPNVSAASVKHPEALVQVQAPWVTFANMTIAMSTQDLVGATGPAGITLWGCSLLGAGTGCASIAGANSSVVSSNISHCGSTGITLAGGNWDSPGQTLFAPANLSVVDSRLSDWARWQRVPSVAGLAWEGVGHRVARSIFTHAPEPAVSANGNVACTFEHNIVDDVNYEQSDMGAYYHGSSAGGYAYGWTQFGNVIAHNVFRNIRFGDRRPASGDFKFTTQAVYMDDELSGYTIENNTFDNVDVGVLIGGGREHVVRRNTFVGCGTACVHVDNRGMNWAHELCGCQCSFGSCVPGCHPGGALGPGLSRHLTADPGTFRFVQGMASLGCVGPAAAPPCNSTPALAWLHSLLHDDAGGGPCAPAHNTFEHNVFDGPAWQFCGDARNASVYSHDCHVEVDANPTRLADWGSVARGNTASSAAGPAARNFSVIPWPARDGTSPVRWAPYMVNWDIGYYDNTVGRTAIARARPPASVCPPYFRRFARSLKLSTFSRPQSRPQTQLLEATNGTDPDIFEWDFGSENNRDHALSARGIYVSSHQSFEVSLPDLTREPHREKSNPSPFSSLVHQWQQTSGAPDANRAFRAQLANNYGIAEDGRPEDLHPDAQNLSCFMSQVAPKWHALTKEGNVRAAAYGQSVTQDNVGNYYGVFHSGGPTLPQDAGFSWGPWINAGFITAYGRRRGQPGVSLPSLPNGTAFQMTAYIAKLRGTRLSPLAITRDPIVHEYIRFAQNVTVGRWVDMRASVQATAAKAKRVFQPAVYGNLECMAFHPDACGRAQNRMGIEAAAHVDVILLEAAMVVPEFKVAVAAGNFEKPVFPYPDMCGGTCDGPTAVARALGATPATNSAGAQWFASHRFLVTDRRPVAEVAVLLDLPVFFWRGFSSVAVPGNQKHVLAMQNVTALLDAEHVPYDLLLHGHPDFYDDSKQWARLGSYRTLVLAGVEAISGANARRIAAFAAAGGRVAVLGECGITDGEDRPWAGGGSACDPLRAMETVKWVSSGAFARWLRDPAGESRRTITQAIGIERDPLLVTDLPANVHTAIWMHGGGPLLSVQIANADPGRTSNATNVDHFMTVKLEGWLQSASDRVEVFFFTWTADAPTPLVAVISDSRINFTVPAFDGRYAAVTIGAPGEAKMRWSASEVRKRTERLSLAQAATPGVDPDAFAGIIGEARTTLFRVQGSGAQRVVPEDVANLGHRLSSLDARLARAAEWATETAYAAAAAARLAAVHTVDSVVRIDFGAADIPAAPGWDRVSPGTRFGPGRHPGWAEGTGERVHLGPAMPALSQGKKVVGGLGCPWNATQFLCSYLFSNSTLRSKLLIPVPRAANYTVQLVFGDPMAMLTRVALTNVWNGDGELIGMGSRLGAPGELVVSAFPTEAPGGVIELDFGGMAVAPMFQFDDRNNGTAFYEMAWALNALLVFPGAHGAHSVAAAESLQAHELVRSAAREWMVLGPLDDSTARCRESAAEVHLDFKGRYPAKGGGVATWQVVQISALLAVVDFHAAGIRDGDGLGAAALAVTHIHVNGTAPLRLRLVGSTAGVGAASISGRPAFVDELNAGLLEYEEHSLVTLDPGWNVLRVRSCTKWGAQGWSLWVGLTLPDGSHPVPGVSFSACGPACA